MKSRFTEEPSYSQISKLYLPLALSWLLMLMDIPVLNAFLARAPEAELSLAAFGIANSLVFMLEAPIYMILDLSIALSGSRAAFRTLRRFYVVMGLGLTALGVLVLYTPLWQVLLQGLMGIPASIAPTAASTLRILVWLVFPIGWRRLHQGVLVRDGRTPIIGMGTAIRLVVVSVGILVGQALTTIPAVYLGALAAGAGALVETALMHWAAQSSIAQRPAENAANETPVTFGTLWSLFVPLAITSVLFQLIPPLVSAGVASAPMPELSLAAWPVAWALVTVFWAPTMGLRQVSVALAQDRASWGKVSRFVAIAGVVLTGALGLLSLTPLLEVVLSGLLGVSGPVAVLASPAVRIMLFLPLGYSIHSLYGGLLVTQSRPSIMRTAKVVNLLIVGIILWAGLLHGQVHGATLGALAMTAGTLMEAVWLWFFSRAVVQTLRSPVSSLAR